MAKDSRKEYEVEINGLKHRMLLNDEDAQRFGKVAKPVSNKQRTPQNKVRTPGEGSDESNENLV